MHWSKTHLPVRKGNFKLYRNLTQETLVRSVSFQHSSVFDGAVDQLWCSILNPLGSTDSDTIIVTKPCADDIFDPFGIPRPKIACQLYPREYGEGLSMYEIGCIKHRMGVWWHALSKDSEIPKNYLIYQDTPSDPGHRLFTNEVTVTVNEYIQASQAFGKNCDILAIIDQFKRTLIKQIVTKHEKSEKIGIELQNNLQLDYYQKMLKRYRPITSITTSAVSDQVSLCDTLWSLLSHFYAYNPTSVPIIVESNPILFASNKVENIMNDLNLDHNTSDTTAPTWFRVEIEKMFHDLCDSSTSNSTSNHFLKIPFVVSQLSDDDSFWNVMNDINRYFINIENDLPCLPIREWLELMIGFRGEEDRYDLACQVSRCNNSVSASEAKNLDDIYNDIWTAYNNILIDNGDYLSKLLKKHENGDMFLDLNNHFKSLFELERYILSPEFPIALQEKLDGIKYIRGAIKLITQWNKAHIYDKNQALCQNYLSEKTIDELKAGVRFIFDDKLDLLRDFYEPNEKYFTQTAKHSYMLLIRDLELLEDILDRKWWQ